MTAPERWDAVVIGAGFYGTAIACYLRQQRHRARVLVVDAQEQLFDRASRINQARVHGGYHYPRSFTTAYRSRVNLPRFLADYGSAVRQDATSLYAIARRNSKVSARQFRRFAKEIGAPLEPAPRELASLFDARLVEAVFVAREYVFDWSELARLASSQLASLDVELRLATRATTVCRAGDALRVDFASGCRAVETPLVLNCCYAGLGQLGGDASVLRTALKHELAELALVEVPPALTQVGITLMDGAFFSLQPFPARGLHSLTHVRYTPHWSMPDSRGEDPYARLRAYDRQSRYERMQRDVRRYVPALAELRHVESLFTVKTVLVKNETDDGRPILLERDAALPGLISVLGGKLDNIYDVLERLDGEVLPGD